MPPSRRKLPLIVLWALAILSAFVLVLISTLALGGWWLEHRTLRQEFRFGENKESTLRVHGGRFSWWNLSFTADSAWYRSRALDVRLGRLRADADLLSGLMTFMPAAAITADSAFMHLRIDTLPKKKNPLDSLALPDFKIPLAASFKLRRLRVQDDSGMWVRADTVSIRNRGAQKAQARARTVRTSWTKNLSFSAWAYADWSVRDSLDMRAGIVRTLADGGKDRVTLKGRHAKRPLWRGHDALEATIAETKPYARAFMKRSSADSLPNVRDVHLTVETQLSKSPELDLKLSGAVAAYSPNGDFTLSPQKVDLSAEWKNKRGKLRLQSRGRAGEDVLLQADARLLPGFDLKDSVLMWTYLEHTAVSLRGHARKFRVKVQDTVRSADLVIEKADWNGSRLAVSLLTGDGSRLEAAGRRKPAGDWNASFSLDVKPKESWVRVFTGDNISFATLNAKGEAQKGRKARDVPTVRATLSARTVMVYGFKLDSLRSFHTYGPEGYTLEPSRLYDQKTVWTLEGTIKPPKGKKGGVDLDAKLSSPGHGSLRYVLRPDGTMEATAALFDVGALPYALLDSLPFRDPVLDGIFVWNPGRKTGRADLGAQARIQKSDVEVRVRGSWDANRLNLDLAGAKMKGSEINVGARLRMNDRQFWEAYKVKPAQYEYAKIQSPGFDIAAALKLFQPEPVLVKGSVKGELSYGDKTGFKGKLSFDAITPREAIGDVVLKDLDLEGNGDTLFVDARTTSESVKPLNAKLRLALSSLLRDEQHVRADIVAGDSLRVRLDAATQRFQSFRGTLSAAGRVVLPEKSGSVERIDIVLDVDVPLVDPVNRSTMAARSFTGVYVLPGLSRQTFSLDPVLKGGVFRVSRFSVKNDQGQSVSGSLEYALARKSLKAHVQGESFTAQWADDYKAELHDLNFDFARDAQGLRIDGRFSRGSFLYVDAPLYARGTMTSVRFGYDAPASASGPGAARLRRERAPATLDFSGNLSESLVRYRLKSFADLQRLFRRERKKRRTGPPLRLNVKVQTLGNDNYIDSDILRLTWVGNLSVRGEHPYTLFNGRINSLNGGLGLDKQAYDIRRFEVKWLNAPMEEGRVEMDSRKELAADCNHRSETEVDSCTVITRLSGKLSAMQFSYDTDCGGAYGAGGSVTAILYSVQRGCYDASFATGSDGRSYGNKALTLLEPTINRRLSSVVGRYSGKWIEATEVSGLGALSGEDGRIGDTLGEALSLGLTSKEFKRFRLRAKSGYHTASQDLSNPWEHMVGLEFRPPAEYLTKSRSWQRRLNENLRVIASLQTHAVKVEDPEEDEIEKKIALTYSYIFWGNWWSKPRKREEAPAPLMVKPAQTTGEPAK